ncbi:hypothetical protein OA45_05107 [Bacillus sp. UMTAT18]|jgi:hypothetical protein|nr:hypothetical protein OA45_05107 [Bacillus sp. UMTAT18]CJB83935.1 Uncharacterised protein [Streptococcus pneumoniae]COJ48464.1 Uncharacterised protein [Streptococcus pneumoniae]SME38323.1 hypothetical protein BACERE00196_04964 [Bacillus cereus]
MIDAVSEKTLIAIDNFTVFLYIAVVIYCFSRLSHRKQ